MGEMREQERKAIAGVLDASWKEIEMNDGKKALEAQISVMLPMPDQDEQLPNKMERMREDAGQEIKRIIFKLGMELADLELVLSQRAGKEGYGIQRVGKRSYRFKTIFGTVKINRIRVKHKKDGTTEVMAVKAWKTPRQLMITKGLREAVSDTAAKESYKSTVKQMERRTGESKAISKSSVCKILREEGRKLSKGQAERAARTYEKEKEAKRVFAQSQEKDEESLDQKQKNSEAEMLNAFETDEISKEIEIEARLEEAVKIESEAEKGEAVNIEAVNIKAANIEEIEPERTETEKETREAMGETPEMERGQVILQADEVMVRKRMKKKGQRGWVIHYNAVVKTEERSYYISAGDSEQLWCSWFSRKWEPSRSAIEKS